MTLTTAALCIVGAAGIAGWLFLALVHLGDRYKVGHVQGHWMALAQYAKDFAVVDIDHPIEGQPISMMTLQGDQVWLNWINTWVDLKKQSGFFDSLFQKWMAG